MTIAGIEREGKVRQAHDRTSLPILRLRSCFDKLVAELDTAGRLRCCCEEAIGEGFRARLWRRESQVSDRGLGVRDGEVRSSVCSWAFGADHGTIGDADGILGKHG